MDKLETETASDAEKKNVASRSLVATAFGVAGFKLSNIGTAVDVNEMLKGMTPWEKTKAIFSKEIFAKIGHKINSIAKEENINKAMATAKAARYTLITGAIGAAAGGVIGWVRGDKIDNWKDIIHHPIDSTKIVFGFKEPKKSEDAVLYAKSGSDVTTEIPTGTNATKIESANPTSWQDYAKERKENPQIIARS